MDPTPDTPVRWTGIAWCPCCASPIDVVGEAGLRVSLTCGTCTQEFSMTIDPARFAEHALT